MNRFCFLVGMLCVVLYLVSVTMFGFYIHKRDIDTYGTFKDMIPVLIAIAAAAITGLVQYRISFLIEVRKHYALCVNAFDSALQYTHLDQPKQSEFAAVHKEIATAIEMLRGSFRNLGADKGRTGLFPFEALKSILEWHCYLDFGKNFKKAEARKARRSMLFLWQSCLHPAILAELDRSSPRRFLSHYWGRGIGKGWPLAPAADDPKVAYLGVDDTQVDKAEPEADAP